MDYTPIILVVAVPLVIAAQIYLLVRKMSEPEKMFRPIDGGLNADRQRLLLEHKDWLAAHDLQYLTCFQFGAVQLAVFQHADGFRFFCFHFHQSITYAVESYLDDLTCLDTGNSGHIGLFPRPGGYAQNFRNVSCDEVWQRHVEAETYLAKKFGFVWKRLGQPYEQILLDAIRLRMKYVRSVPFWPIRVLYRYAITRPRLVNKSVQQQHP